MPSKKITKADVYRKWGIPEHLIRGGGLKTLLRYTNPPEKGVYWYFFSRLIRMRDVKNYGTCISCGRVLTFETAQAGHFMPAADCGRDLLFDFQNVNAECSHCNAWDDTHLLGYAEGLDRRYGEGTAHRLRSRRDTYKEESRNGKPQREWKSPVYEEKIVEIKKKIDDLKT